MQGPFRLLAMLTLVMSLSKLTGNRSSLFHLSKTLVILLAGEGAAEEAREGNAGSRGGQTQASHSDLGSSG